MSTNYKIVVDSTIDLPLHLADELGLTIIPFIFTLDGKDYYNHLDYSDMSVKDFYKALRDGTTGSTTQITAFRYVEAWEPILKEGKDILCISLSSGVSKSYEQSLIAVKEMKEKYPDRKIISIDSKSGALGEGIIAYYAARSRDDKKSLEETAAYIESLVPRMQHWIMVDDLHHLRRGGRVSGATAFVGTILSIKPILTLVDDGRIVPVHKVRGRNNALKYFLEKMNVQDMEPKGLIGIVHSDMPELAQQLKEMIIEKFGPSELIINDLGPVVGTHTGPGTIAVMFLGGKRANA